VILNITLLLITILLLIFLSMIWPPDSPWSPWWRTSDKTIKRALKLANVKNSDVVYDLGSGDGRSLIIAAGEFNARAVGIEIDPLRFFISKLLIWFSGLSNRVEVRRENFLNSNISEATVVFLYLVPKALERLRPKLLKELKPGTKVISIKYEIELPLDKKISGNDRVIRLYRTPKK
jgi:predicted RNA methylase